MCCAAAVDSPLLASRRQTSTFSLSRQSSNVSVSVSVAHHEPAGDGAFGRQASVASTVNSEAQGAAHIGAGEVGGHFMQPLTDISFLLVRTSMIRVRWCVCVCGASWAFFVCTALVCKALSLQTRTGACSIHWIHAAPGVVVLRDVR